MILSLWQVILIALISAIPVKAETAAEALSPLALLNRCYFHLTQRRIPLNHPLRGSVMRGMDPIAACETLLDGTILNPSSGSLQTASEDNLRVLRTFNDFHRTWFPRDDLVNAVVNGTLAAQTKEIHDTGEAGLHVSRAMFAKDARFQDIVTGSHGMEALRSGGAVSNNSREQAKRFVGATIPGDQTQFADLNSELVQQGELFGIRSLAYNTRKQGAVTYSGVGFYPKIPVRVHQSAGGGILGTRSFLLSNLGLPNNNGMDGGLRMSREFSKSVLKNFLCRDIPVIRTSDALPYVQKMESDTPAFRGNANCMTCHATVDPLAAVARNNVITHIPFLRQVASQTQGRSFAQIFTFPVDQVREVGMVKADVGFHRRPAHGRLYFRDYKGELRNEEVLGIAELGKVLADSEDLYVCAASRYLQYFTGVQVALHDPGDANFAPPSDAEREYREWVVKLGLELMVHQSPKKLVKQILESPLYQSAAMRTYGEIRDGQ